MGNFGCSTPCPGRTRSTFRRLYRKASQGIQSTKIGILCDRAIGLGIPFDNYETYRRLLEKNISKHVETL